MYKVTAVMLDELKTLTKRAFTWELAGDNWGELTWTEIMDDLEEEICDETWEAIQHDARVDRTWPSTAVRGVIQMAELEADGIMYFHG